MQFYLPATLRNPGGETFLFKEMVDCLRNPFLLREGGEAGGRVIFIFNTSTSNNSTSNNIL
jgi:hypothetical protein